jgi:hypothetical protein
MEQGTTLNGQRTRAIAGLGVSSLLSACVLWACQSDAGESERAADGAVTGKLALALSAEAEPLANEPSPTPLGLPPGDLLVQALTSSQVSVASDGTNRCLAGGFSDTIQLGSLELTSAGRRDIFVSRWAGSELSWAIRLGGEGDEAATGVALGPDGSCVIAGLFRDVVNLGGTELQAAPVNTTLGSDPPGQYSAFVAQVAQTRAINVRDDLALATREPAALGAARSIPTIDPGAIGLLSRVVVSGAQAIRGPLLPLGSSVGVSVEPAGQILLALPEGGGVVLGTPQELNQRHLIIPLQCLAPDYEFDLCSGSSSRPKLDCISAGRDHATAVALGSFCALYPGCCGSTWTGTCAADFEAASSVCQCAPVASLLSPPGGVLPRQASCCNSVTESVCQLRPRCCTRKWDSTCALLAASAQPICE